MPRPLSSFFSKVFKANAKFVEVLKDKFQWNCVEKFETATDYESVIEEFRVLYEQKFLSTSHQDTAGDFYANLNTAKENAEQNQPPEPFLSTLKKHEIIITTLRKSDLQWDCMALFESGTSDSYFSEVRKIVEFYEKNFNQLSPNSWNTSLAALWVELQGVQSECQKQAELNSTVINQDIQEGNGSSDEDKSQGDSENADEQSNASFDRLESALLETAKLLAETSTGKSQESINQFSSIAKKHANNNQGDNYREKRKRFREVLIQTAVQNLSFKSAKEFLSYLESSYQSKLTDVLDQLMHYTFLSALIKKEAQHYALEFSREKDFIALEKLVNGIEALAHECRQSKFKNIRSHAQELAACLTDIMNQLACDDSLTEIDREINRSKQGKPTLKNLRFRIFVIKLPMLQVIINLCPEANTWFLDKDFASAINTMSALSDQGIHAMLIALLKVCFTKTENFEPLRNTLLLLFMLMEKPTHPQFVEMLSLLSQHKTDQKYWLELLRMRYNAVQTTDELVELSSYIAKEHVSLTKDLTEENKQAQLRLAQSNQVASHQKTFSSQSFLVANLTLKQYRTLLIAVSQSNQPNAALMDDLLQQALSQAKTADDLISLTPVCKTPELVNHLADRLCRFHATGQHFKKLFTQSILPQTKADRLKTQLNAFEGAKKCDEWWSLIERYVVPYISKDEVAFNEAVKQQCKVIRQAWVHHLEDCEDQFKLSETILLKRQILFPQDGDGQVYSELFNRTRQQMSEMDDISLEQLQGFDTLFRRILSLVEKDCQSIPEEYAKLESNYKMDCAKLIDQKKVLVETIHQQAYDLRQSLQVVIHENSAKLKTLQSMIPSEVNRFDAVKAIQIHLIELSKKNEEDNANVLLKIEKLVEESELLQPIIQSLSNMRDGNSDSEQMQQLRRYQGEFQFHQSQIKQNLKKIENQINGLQKKFFAQTMQMKKEVSQKTIDLKIACDAEEAKQKKFSDEREPLEKRLEEIPLVLGVCVDSIKAAIDNKTLENERLSKNQESLEKLESDTLETVSKEIHLLCRPDVSSKSLETFVKLFNAAIERRKSEQNSVYTKFRLSMARFIAEYEISFWMPNRLLNWSKVVSNDLQVTLVSEINALEVQKQSCERLLQSFLTEKNKILVEAKSHTYYASEIRTAIMVLCGEDLKIRGDQRAPFWWRWWADYQVNSFVSDNQRLKDKCQKLSETQAQIDALKKMNEAIESKLSQFDLEFQKATQEKSQLQIEQQTKTSQLDLVQRELAEIPNKLKVISEQYQCLNLLNTTLTQWVASPLIDVLYDASLDDAVKLTQLKKRINEDKQCLLRDSMGGDIFANPVYHVVRQGTVDMLQLILNQLPELERNRYLTTLIQDGKEAITPLCLAVKRGDLAKMNAILAFKVGINVPFVDENGNETTVLLWAYRSGKADMVQALIAAGADYTLADGQGNALLHHAAIQGDAAMIEQLLGKLENSSLAAKNREGNDVLALLMKSKASVDIKHQLTPVLLKHLPMPSQLDGNYLNEVDKYGNNLLHLAIKNSDLKWAKWLLAQSNESLLNAKNIQGESPLSLAVEAENLSIVKWLLSQPKLNDIQLTFLNTLKSSKTSSDLIEVFLKYYQGNLNDIELNLAGVNRLLHKLKTEDSLKIKANSYLYLTSCPTLAQVKLLIRHGANPHAVNAEGDTALHHAVLAGDYDRVCYLIDRCSIDPHAQNQAGLTPLMALYAKGELPNGSYRRIVDKLMKKTRLSLQACLPGQSPELLTKQDNQGNTLLHYAVGVGDVAVVKILVEQKPYFGKNPLNCQNAKGETAFHWLAKNPDLQPRLVEHLIEFLHNQGQASLNCQDKQSKAPLDYASSYYTVIALVKALSKDGKPINILPTAYRILADKTMTDEQKKGFVEGMANAAGMNSFRVTEFYADALKTHCLANHTVPDWTSDIRYQNTYNQKQFMNEFSSQSSNKKMAEFSTMIIGQKVDEVAWILDSGWLSFPDDLNQPPSSYLNFTDNTQVGQDRKNFWVRVVENRQDKRLVFQDRDTGHTLLHALISLQDLTNLNKLNQAGVLYVTETNKENKTILDLAREKNSMSNELNYHAIILRSVERRLLVEFSCSVLNESAIATLMAQLDFNQLTEMEMLVSLFKQLHARGKIGQSECLWTLTDKNGKTLAQAALVALNKNPSDQKCQQLLVDLLSTRSVKSQSSQMEASKLSASKAEMKLQISHFSNKKAMNYSFSENELQARVLEFGRHYMDSSKKNAIFEAYQELCRSSKGLLKSTQIANVTSQSSFFAFGDNKEKSNLTVQQLRENYGHNMLIYLGLFIEASGMDVLVTLPSSEASSCRSLLAVAREKQLTRLYIQIVEYALNEFELNHPLKMVRQAQAAETFAYNKLFDDNVQKFNGIGIIVKSPMPGGKNDLMSLKISSSIN